jgi:hypothetical protein
MMEKEDRRSESRMLVESPALVFWETDDGPFELKALAVDLGKNGLALRLSSRLKRDTIVWCAVPSYGVYSRAKVCHTRGLFRPLAGLQFLAGSLHTD